LRLKNCYRTSDFRKLAKQRLPAPIFHYIDGGSDDEVTLARNTEAFNDVDLVPNVLAGVDDIDMSCEVLGQRLDMPLFFAPTAMQRLFHHEGEFAIADAAEKYGTMLRNCSRSMSTPTRA
jgi:L-lactate dehydrogenase (cytochrome)